jgi:hypothetical protein
MKNGQSDGFAYSLHGLTVDSELELPQLRRSSGGPSDVTIGFGPVYPMPADAASQFRNWTARPGEMVITAIDSARFRVTGGDKIVIDPLPTATRADLISFTLGSAMSALLQQRQLLPLHASSVATENGALLITGRSGAGKSTLVAEFVRLGLPILADDVTAIGQDPAGRPLAMPGLPALRLWRDALQRLGREGAAIQQVREDVDKFYLPIVESCAVPQPVLAIVRLKTKAAGDLTVVELEGIDKVRWLAQHVHRKHFMPGMGLQQFAFDSTVNLARNVPILELIRSDQGPAPDIVARKVLDWLYAKQLLRSGGGWIA